MVLVVAKMRLPPALFAPRTPPGGGASSAPSWQTLALTTAEGPTELRAPEPRDSKIRHGIDSIKM